MRNSVGPNVDVYGNLARAGALADYLEVRALHGVGISAAELQDIATEQGWSRKERRTILVEGDDPDVDPEQWSEMAFAEVSAREVILSDSYPFVLSNGRLEYGGTPDPIDDEYLALLAITVVHGWSLMTSVQPEVVLEDVARRVLEGLGVLTADMGTGDRQGISFANNLMQKGTLVGFSPTTTPRPIQTAAKDAGVDTLGALGWRDGRQGYWGFIGQVTCGSSSTWKRKLKEPEPEVWRKYLQDSLRPLRFLVVPHHVDHRQWDLLADSGDGLVIDRLRMVMTKGANSSDEKLLISTLLSGTSS